MKTYRAEKIRRNRLRFSNRKVRIYTEKDFLSCQQVYCIKDFCTSTRGEYVEYNKGQSYDSKKETIGDGRFMGLRVKENWMPSYPKYVIYVEDLIEHFRPI